MKFFVKQMGDWNSYAYCVEEVDEAYWDYFKSGYWWQIGNHFIKVYDQVPDFQYCAENFKRYGEQYIKQSLKIEEASWEKALDRWISQMKELDVPWYIHGSAAMALWGMDVKPRNLDIIVPNASDFDKVRTVFYKFAIVPIQRCDHWVMSGGGDLFLDTPVSVYFHNKDCEPYDMDKLGKINYYGKEIRLSTLEMLHQDNQAYGRTERVRLIEEKLSEMKETSER